MNSSNMKNKPTRRTDPGALQFHHSASISASISAPTSALISTPISASTSTPISTPKAPTARLRCGLALVAALMLALAGVAQATERAETAETVVRLSGVVNLNTADIEQLQMLPGVGEKRAAAIIEIRSSKGGFKTVEEIVEVKGVGDALLERLRPHLTLSGKTTAKLL